MKKVWRIAVNDLRMMMKDKIFFFWVLVFPIFFVMIFGNIYREDSARPQASLVIVNRDSGPWGEYFVGKLKSPDLQIQVVSQEPEDFIRLLTLPEDFSERIRARKAGELVLQKNAGTNIRAAAMTEVRIVQAIARLIVELVLYGDRDTSVFFTDHPEFRDIMQIRSRFPDHAPVKTPSGFDHVIPGIMIHFIMMMVLIYGGISVIEDRQRGVLLRLMAGPLLRLHLFGGKFLGRLLMGLLQAVILIGAGLLFFSLNLGNILFSMLNILIFCAVIAALGIMLGSLIGKEDLMIGVSILFANVFAALGGCWWPIEVVPPAVRSLGVISPAYWAMDVFHKVIFFGKGFSDIAVNFIVLSLFGIVFTLMSWRWFRLRD